MKHYISLLTIAVLMTVSCSEHKKEKPSEKEKYPTASALKTEKKTPPNLVLIVADDQGWGDLSYNGNTNLQTPNIDSLALNGISFNNFYVQPVCSPTRAELLTGRHFTRLGVYATSEGGERMNLDETTLADVLKKEGYATAAYGKWHNGMQPPYHPNSRGFDDFYGFASGHWGSYFDPMLEHNGTIVKGNGFLVDDLTNKGLQFIEKEKEGPFFLYLPYNTPHSPMQVPDAYWNKFKDATLEKRYTGNEEEDVTFTKAALAMVENIDHNVGRVVSRLKELGLEENTIVIFMSDNGPNGWRWNAGMRGKKGSTDEGGVRSPLHMQWKGTLKAGKRITQIASAIDILPTLAGLFEISTTIEKPIDGLDLSKLLLNDTVPIQDRFIYNHWNGRTSVRNQHYRLDETGRLYDMKKDVGQTSDISKNLPLIKDSLEQAKSKWLKNTGAIQPLQDQRPFTLGHPEHKYTQLPARDGKPHGTIKRSNRFPNDTFFTNWTSISDAITWDINVLESGSYEVTMLYTLAKGDEGVAIQLKHDEHKLIASLTESHDPPLTGMEHDRSPRMESYVKDFKSKILGNISLAKGRSPLVLEAVKIPGNKAMDVRLLLFKRVD